MDASDKTFLAGQRGVLRLPGAVGIRGTASHFIRSQVNIVRCGTDNVVGKLNLVSLLAVQTRGKREDGSMRRRTRRRSLPRVPIGN